MSSYKVLDIYRELPRTNCGDCGRKSCFAFASAVYLDAFPLERCPHLDPVRRAEMQKKIPAGRGEVGGASVASSEKALRALLATLKDADLATQAEKCGGLFFPAPEEQVLLRFLDGEYWVTRTVVRAASGEDPTVWVKIFLLIYLTRATGRPEGGTWVSYRDLPNTASKAKSFDDCTARVAAEFAGHPERLERAVLSLGGVPVESSSADRAYRLQVLPRVPVALLFWDKDEEFPARVLFLLDGRVLDYLDQEALVFLAEALAGRLLGQDLNAVVG